MPRKTVARRSKTRRSKTGRSKTNRGCRHSCIRRSRKTRKSRRITKGRIWKPPRRITKGRISYRSQAGMYSDKRFTMLRKIEGTSNKYWGVRIEGDYLIKRWGRVGYPPKEQKVRYSNPHAQAAKEVSQKRKRGYFHV